MVIPSVGIAGLAGHVRSEHRPCEPARMIGLGSLSHPWLGDPNTALWAIIMMGFPFVGIRTAGNVLGADRHSGRSDRSGENRRRQILPHYPGDSPAALAGQALIVLALIGIIQDFGSILIVTGGACGLDLCTCAADVFCRNEIQ